MVRDRTLLCEVADTYLTHHGCIRNGVLNNASCAVRFMNKEDSYREQIARQHSCHKNCPGPRGVVDLAVKIYLSSTSAWSPCKIWLLVSYHRR